MIATSGINIANNYKKFGGTVEALQVKGLVPCSSDFVASTFPPFLSPSPGKAIQPASQGDLDLLPLSCLQDAHATHGLSDSA